MAWQSSPRLIVTTAAGSLLALALGIGGYDYAVAQQSRSAFALTGEAASSPSGASGVSGASGSVLRDPRSGSPGWIPGGVTAPQGQSGRSAQSGTSAGTSSTEASATQLVGVVDVVTTIDFGSGQAAGTGIVLTSSGRILTNNHVVSGATSIKVTDLSTGKSYTADVVGTSPTNDVAVIQLEDASGLQAARLGDSASVSVGDAVVGVGNAGGDAGTLASSGRVTALDQSINATDESGQQSEQLIGLIETNAPIEAGDSGGPLYAADGTIIGIDTAGQSSARTGATVAAYAIPIDHALDIAKRIVAGESSTTIHQGRPAFLGVTQPTSSSGRSGFTSSGAGVTISGVIPGTAAGKAGLAAGDTITSLGGMSVTSPSALSAAIAAHHPGDSVKVTWVDASGKIHTATVTLGEGPAD